MRTGNYTVSATPYSMGNQMGVPYSMSFSVINQAPIVVDSLLLVNAQTDETIGVLGDIIDLAEVGNALNIVAVTDPEMVGSVVMQLRGSFFRNQTENVVPYALFGDNSGDFNSWPGGASQGTYELTVIPYTQANGRGVRGTATTKSFEIINTGAAAAAVLRVGGANCLLWAGKNWSFSPTRPKRN